MGTDKYVSRIARRLVHWGGNREYLYRERTKAGGRGEQESARAAIAVRPLTALYMM